MEWQKIDIAPKDGTKVLLYWPDGKIIATGSWDSPMGFCKHWCKEGKPVFGINPSHWMQLPNTPEEE